MANPLRAQFASWLGWLVGRDQSLVFVVGADQDRVELVRQCHQIGHDHLQGELAGGTAAWAAAGLPLTQTAVFDAASVRGQLLDVRQEREHADGHIPGVAHVELGRLASVAADLGQIDAVMCGHGERAATATSLLERDGHPGVAVVIGGPNDWATATGLPLCGR